MRHRTCSTRIRRAAAEEAAAARGNATMPGGRRVATWVGNRNLALTARSSAAISRVAGNPSHREKSGMKREALMALVALGMALPVLRAQDTTRAQRPVATDTTRRTTMAAPAGTPLEQLVTEE